MRELTKRQSEIYDYIKHVVQTKGYPPSVREIGDCIVSLFANNFNGSRFRRVSFNISFFFQSR
jgi:SOS-response transcriptional repressor LexA